MPRRPRSIWRTGAWGFDRISRRRACRSRQARRRSMGFPRRPIELRLGQRLPGPEERAPRRPRLRTQRLAERIGAFEEQKPGVRQPLRIRRAERLSQAEETIPDRLLGRGRDLTPRMLWIGELRAEVDEVAAPIAVLLGPVGDVGHNRAKLLARRVPIPVEGVVPGLEEAFAAFLQIGDDEVVL